MRDVGALAGIGPHTRRPVAEQRGERHDPIPDPCDAVPGARPRVRGHPWPGGGAGSRPRLPDPAGAVHPDRDRGRLLGAADQDEPRRHRPPQPRELRAHRADPELRRGRPTGRRGVPGRVRVRRFGRLQGDRGRRLLPEPVSQPGAGPPARRRDRQDRGRSAAGRLPVHRGPDRQDRREADLLREQVPLGGPSEAATSCTTPGTCSRPRWPTSRPRASGTCWTWRRSTPTC